MNGIRFAAIIIFTLVFGTAFFTGCSSGRPRTQMIEGTVTYNGEPVEGALVGMTPIDDPKGLPAFGRTNAQGRYTITSLRGGREGGGAQIGKYRVTVSKEVPSREMTPAEQRAYDRHGTMPNIQPKHVLPLRYSVAGQSGLEVQVDKGKNTFDFNLADE